METGSTLLPGRHEPMGAHVTGGGVNFAVFSQNAERIELCLFDETGTHELARHPLHGPHDHVFHGFLPQAQAGLIYGLRADGRFDPNRGHRFNAHTLLLDPCAREIVGAFQWRREHRSDNFCRADTPNSMSKRSNAAYSLKARVAQHVAHSPRASAPHIAANDVVLYEVHVKGFSQRHPGIPAAIRGTFLALAHPTSIAYFKQLGVTTLSLLPVQYHLDEPALSERGVTNYWGYNTLGFSCADPRFATQANDPTAANAQFREMVSALHENDLEVVLDVVYNHTPEGDEAGPTLSFRGLDNASWYRLAVEDASRYENVTGCGNTLNMEHPRVAQFVLDSLRFWVSEMGVDGFRFDLAPVLGRTRRGFDTNAAFFTALRQDPVLARVHLIAEPWDAASDGYQVGRFPGRFVEWNDKFRDTVREFWLYPGAGKASRGEFAQRFTASSDLFNHNQRRPTASVNFIAVHDGFSLTDVVSYSRKHNAKNGENNRDGREGETCNNFGVEGATSDVSTQRTRKNVRRAMMATLLLAQGTPMLCAGDEIGRSQLGNNNPYCLDDATTWLDWANADDDFRRFVSGVLALRRTEPLLRNDMWFAAYPSDTHASVVWLNATGQPMTISDWHDASQHSFACQMCSAAPNERSLLVMFNPQPVVVTMALPAGTWQLLFDSADELTDANASLASALTVPARSLVALRSSVALSVTTV